MTGNLQVKKGYYYMVLNLKYENGKLSQKWISTGLPEKNNKRKAEQLLRETINKYENDFVEITKKIPFWKFMEEWLDIIKTQVVSTTYNSYKLVVQNNIIPYFKGTKISLQELQPLHIQKYYSQRLKGGITASTLKHYHANIHKALNYAVKANMIPYNPASRVELPKLERFVGKTYTESQLIQLLNAVRETEIETAIILAVSYGLRRSEIIGLKWGAINFEDKTLVIRHTVTGNGKTMLCADKTKNKSSYRTLPLINGLHEYLLKVHLQQQRIKAIMGNSYINSDYVCCWNDGKLIRPEHLSRKFNKIIISNGLPKIRFHDLRHTSASLLISNGFNLKEVSEWLGHADISTTANIYAHLQYQSKLDIGQKMSDKFFSDKV